MINVFWHLLVFFLMLCTDGFTKSGRSLTGKSNKDILASLNPEPEISYTTGMMYYVLTSMIGKWF